MSDSSRRELLKSIGDVVRGESAMHDGRPALPLSGRGQRLQTAPSGSDTIRVSCRAMACEFTVIMNPGAPEELGPAGDTLQMIHDIELWLSVYRDNSEISFVNRLAASEPIHVRRSLLELLQTSVRLHKQTQGAFDIAAGSLIQLWREARGEQRIPQQKEIDKALQASGSGLLKLDEPASTVRFLNDGVLLDPGAIGKGFALDEVTEWLGKTVNAPTDFLVHGGHSSLAARGNHNGLEGWPVGIGNPLFTGRRLATVLLQNQAMSTSGSNIQYFRHEGRRYGHILDPRSGWPVEGMLSVTVLAQSAAVADAVSTAFFVLGVEKAKQCCENLEGVGVILIPFPVQKKKLEPVIIGIPQDQIFWDESQVDLV